MLDTAIILSADHRPIILGERAVSEAALLWIDPGW
jgi:hypothetical protein